MKYNRPLTATLAAAGIWLGACTSESSNKETPHTPESPATSTSAAPWICESRGHLSKFEAMANDAGETILRITGIENNAECVEMYDEATLRTLYDFRLGVEVRGACLQPDKPSRLNAYIEDLGMTIRGEIPLSEEGLALAHNIGMAACELPTPES